MDASACAGAHAATAQPSNPFKFPEETRTLSVRVVRKATEAEGIVSFELELPDGSSLPAFTAGSHIDVHVPGCIVRQYSLCNDPVETHRYRIAVLRDQNSRGGSAAMHDAVQQGDMLLISAPRNHFPLMHARRTLLFAGGIGVTPLLCMARHLHAIGADFTLHYSTRSAARTAFLVEIATSSFAENVKVHHDDGPPEQLLNVHQAIGLPSPDTHLYVCGPAAYIEHVVQAAQGLSWPASHIHLEYFSAAPASTESDRAFQVKLVSSGKVCHVAAGETVVEALRRQGIEILTSCEQGVCGTCITRVLEGECDHRDLYLTDEERAKHDQFTPCCSRARSGMLVLDL